MHPGEQGVEAGGVVVVVVEVEWWRSREPLKRRERPSADLKASM
jgi:hypothetical protein